MTTPLPGPCFAQMHAARWFSLGPSTCQLCASELLKNLVPSLIGASNLEPDFRRENRESMLESSASRNDAEHSVQGIPDRSVTCNGVFVNKPIIYQHAKPRGSP